MVTGCHTNLHRKPAVVRKNSIRSGRLLQKILVVKSAKNSGFLNDMVSGNEMPVAVLLRGRMQPCGHGRSKAHVGATVIVMPYPF